MLINYISNHAISTEGLRKLHTVFRRNLSQMSPTETRCRLLALVQTNLIHVTHSGASLGLFPQVTLECLNALMQRQQSLSISHMQVLLHMQCERTGELPQPSLARLTFSQLTRGTRKPRRTHSQTAQHSTAQQRHHEFPAHDSNVFALTHGRRVRRHDLLHTLACASECRENASSNELAAAHMACLIEGAGNAERLQRRTRTKAGKGRAIERQDGPQDGPGRRKRRNRAIDLSIVRLRGRMGQGDGKGESEGGREEGRKRECRSTPAFSPSDLIRSCLCLLCASYARGSMQSCMDPYALPCARCRDPYPIMQGSVCSCARARRSSSRDEDRSKLTSMLASSLTHSYMFALHRPSGSHDDTESLIFVSALTHPRML
jgi:hypothetical protein